MRGIIIVLLALQICGSLGNSLHNRHKSIDEHKVSGYFNEFAKDLYQKISKNEQGNFVFSPISVSTVLSMLAIGSSGKSNDELNQILHFNNDWVAQHPAIKPLLEKLNGFSSVDLKLANKIFLSNLVSLDDRFNGVAEYLFNSSTQSVDFSDGDNASESINKWCEEHTNSKIKNMVSPGDFDLGTVMVLLNAVYFKGNWAVQFDKSETKNLPFYLEDGTEKEVPTMSKLGSYRVGSLPHLEAAFVQIPYENADKNDGLSMFIIFPESPSEFRKLEKNLLKLNLKDLLNGKAEELELYLPKFKIESKIDLKTPLNELGLREIFSDKADFQNLVPSGGAKVTKIAQKAFIEVNEEGSEAAAVTNVDLEDRFGGFPATLTIDQPFISLIATKHSILFMSRIVEP